MTPKSYSAPWGRRIWLITLPVVLLGLAVAVVLPLVIKDPKKPIDLWVLPALFAAIYGTTALFCVRGYEITDEAILVKRSFWRNKIPIADVTSAEVDPEACKGAFKTIGNDGLFAMHGRFRSKRLGKFQAFVTDPGNSVILRTREVTTVISPENPRQFVNELSRRLRKREGDR